ncbi:MAG: hypothetical protein KZQ80_04350 [Candidatus Thiodiazotropha sp. (ex Monitilora ramsayi)]|nr:hypothetical protein [Candidatus Thiodiazotropha sp. (ex Monitilora ramsayi)]
MLMIEYRDLGWWYWLVTAVLLTLGVFGVSEAFLWAIALTLVQLIHFAMREGSVKAFPVQVRFWYLMLLLLALPQPLQLIFWIPTIGTWAQLTFGYCTMARLVSLFPWNREEIMSWQLIQRTFFSPPVRGNILQGLPPVTRV